LKDVLDPNGVLSPGKQGLWNPTAVDPPIPARSPAYRAQGPRSGRGRP
jgi:hypothetical protein